MPQVGPTTGSHRPPGHRGRLGAPALAAVAALVLTGAAPPASADARIRDVSVEGTRREWVVTPSGALLCQGVTAEEEERPPPRLTTLDDAVVRWRFDGEATAFQLRLRNLRTGATTGAVALQPGDRQVYLKAADLEPLWTPRRPDRAHRVELQFQGPGGTQTFTVEAVLAVWFTYECRDDQCMAATWLDERTPLREPLQALCFVPRAGELGHAGAQHVRLEGRDGRAQARLPTGIALDVARAGCFLESAKDFPVRSVRLADRDSPTFGIPPR